MLNFFVDKTTIHGYCPTELTVNSREDIATDVTVVRDLGACSHFYHRSLNTSPLSFLPNLVRFNFNDALSIVKKKLCLVGG